jgi:hypothetical protein
MATIVHASCAYKVHECAARVANAKSAAREGDFQTLRPALRGPLPLLSAAHPRATPWPPIATASAGASSRARSFSYALARARARDGGPLTP